MARSFSLSLRRMVTTGVHGRSVIFLSGDEWKADGRLSIQPRAVLCRHGYLIEKWLNGQVLSFGYKRIPSARRRGTKKRRRENAGARNYLCGEVYCTTWKNRIVPVAVVV